MCEGSLSFASMNRFGNSNHKTSKGGTNMLDIIKKTMLMGAGLASMTRDKIEELAKELTERSDPRQ